MSQHEQFYRELQKVQNFVNGAAHLGVLYPHPLQNPSFALGPVFGEQSACGVSTLGKTIAVPARFVIPQTLCKFAD